MDNRNSDKDEAKWVEERMAKLSPPPGWSPNTDQAFERILQGTARASSRGRLAMGAVTVVVIGIVLAQLPWKILWTPSPAKEDAATSLHQAKPAASPEPVKASAPLPLAVTQQIVPENEGIVPTPPVQPIPLTREPLSSGQPEQRLKKFPRYLVAETSAMQEPQNAAVVQGQSDTVSPPVLIFQVHPMYTDEARMARVQGTVILLATVREDGSVKVEKVTQGLGYGLDEASVAAVETWKFRPAKRNGEAVAVTTSLTVHFSLR